MQDKYVCVERMYLYMFSHGYLITYGIRFEGKRAGLANNIFSVLPEKCKLPLMNQWTQKRTLTHSCARPRAQNFYLKDKKYFNFLLLCT